jgi:hypothetical protein
LPIACTVCKTISEQSKTTMPGSDGAEIALWILFLLPGIVYSIWRNNAKAEVCPSCNSKAIVPLSSPAGQSIQHEHPNQAIVPVYAIEQSSGRDWTRIIVWGGLGLVILWAIANRM